MVLLFLVLNVHKAIIINLILAKRTGLNWTNIFYVYSLIFVLCVFILFHVYSFCHENCRKGYAFVNNVCKL